jgi:hypothetical protein
LIVTIGRLARDDTACNAWATTPFARAVLAGDEHVGVRRTDAGDDLQHRLHRR